MALDVPLDTAAIVSTVLEGILYGFSLLMFGGTIWALVFGRTRTEMNKPMLLVALLLLVLSTTHIIIDIIRIEQGLVVQRNTFPGGPQAFFADVAQTTFISKNSIYTLQTLLGDGVVIYRCYMVWRSFKIIALPCLLWCSVAASGVGTLYTLSQATATAGNIFAPASARWVTSFYATTLMTNFSSTILLAYRIWSIDKSVSRVRATKGPLRPLLEVVIDSGVLYSVTLLAALSCFGAKSTGQYVVLDMIMPIISIAFYMVIIRVGIAKTGNNTQGISTLGGKSIGNSVIPTNDPQYPMDRMRVHVTKLTETNNGSSYLYDASDRKLDV